MAIRRDPSAPFSGPKTGPNRETLVGRRGKTSGKWPGIPILRSWSGRSETASGRGRDPRRSAESPAQRFLGPSPPFDDSLHAIEVAGSGKRLLEQSTLLIVPSLASPTNFSASVLQLNDWLVPTFELARARKDRPRLHSTRISFRRQVGVSFSRLNLRIAVTLGIRY